MEQKNSAQAARCFRCRVLLALKTEALYLANRTAEALDTIGEAEALVEKTEARWWSAEFYRLRAILLTAMDAAEAEIE